MGAFPVEGVGDILDAVPRLNPDATAHRVALPDVAAPLEDVPEDARAVFDVLGSAPIDPDTVARHLGLAASAVQRLLLELEMRGVVERDRSGLYYKTHR
jgi:predicted Rossmann fold nucleotide-binding protein DprA/Smf involved in DNA uptake